MQPNYRIRSKETHQSSVGDQNEIKHLKNLKHDSSRHQSYAISSQIAKQFCEQTPAILDWAVSYPN